MEIKKKLIRLIISSCHLVFLVRGLEQFYYYIRGLRVFSRRKDVAKDRTTRGTSSIDCRERGSQARGEYPTQYTSRMETARVKEDVGTDTRIIVKE